VWNEKLGLERCGKNIMYNKKVRGRKYTTCSMITINLLGVGTGSAPGPRQCALGVRRVCARSAAGLCRCAGSVRRVCAGQKNPERTNRSMGLAEPKFGVQVSKTTNFFQKAFSKYL
jgi:hypothetical protein